MPLTYSQKIALFMGGVCGASAVFMGVYLPFYSPWRRDSDRIREQLKAERLRMLEDQISRGDGPVDPRSHPGSMWRNINTHQKEKERERPEAAS